MLQASWIDNTTIVFKKHSQIVFQLITAINSNCIVLKHIPGAKTGYCSTSNPFFVLFAEQNSTDKNRWLMNFSISELFYEKKLHCSSQSDF